MGFGGLTLKALFCDLSNAQPDVLGFAATCGQCQNFVEQSGTGMLLLLVLMTLLDF